MKNKWNYEFKNEQTSKRFENKTKKMFSLFNKINKTRKRKYYILIIKLNRNQKNFIRRNKLLSQKLYKFEISCFFRDIKKLNVVAINSFSYSINKNTKMLTLIKKLNTHAKWKILNNFEKLMKNWSIRSNRYVS